MSHSLDRRQFIAGTAAGAGAIALGTDAESQSLAPAGSLAATPPQGFTPFSAPGRVVRVNKANSLRPNGLYPKPEDATAMVNRAMLELTGQSEIAAAWRLLVHPSDKVGIKVNGIGRRNMATNKEVVLAVLNGVIASGVPVENILIYDQYGGFLSSTRVTARDVPAGVRLLVHSNSDVGPATRVPSGRTWYATALLQCTAVINLPLLKDHSICGYTGAMKNMTHGSVKNPEAFHRHHASPQIAELYAHEAIRSRVRVHVKDAFKMLYDGGPLDHPAARIPYEAVFASTDPVAIDKIGWELIDQKRAERQIASLEQAGRAPRYIQQAAELGLGVADRSRIELREITL